jgi:hypothetical protein
MTLHISRGPCRSITYPSYFVLVSYPDFCSRSLPRTIGSVWERDKPCTRSEGLKIERTGAVEKGFLMTIWTIFCWKTLYVKTLKQFDLFGSQYDSPHWSGPLTSDHQPFTPCIRGYGHTVRSLENAHDLYYASTCLAPLGEELGTELERSGVFSIYYKTLGYWVKLDSTLGTLQRQYLYIAYGCAREILQYHIPLYMQTST